MRHSRPLGVRGLGGADIHAPVHEHRVDRDDLGAERLRQREREIGLADRGRSDERERRPSGHAGRPQTATASGAGTSSPARWCAEAAVILACTNVPGSSASGMCTMRLVRVRACVDGSSFARALHQHLERPADLRERAFERDPLLHLHQPVEPLLHDLLRDLVVERRGPRARSRGVLERVRAVEPSPLHDVERLGEVLLGLPGEPDDDVRRHRDAGDRSRGSRRAIRGSDRAGTSGASPSGRGPSRIAAGSGCARRRSASRPSPRSRPG